MRAIDKRLDALEALLAPRYPKEAVYRELACGGIFRRAGTGRLVPADQLLADAGPAATGIVIIYQVDTEPQRFPGWLGVTANGVIAIPDNGRDRGACERKNAG